MRELADVLGSCMQEASPMPPNAPVFPGSPRMPSDIPVPSAGPMYPGPEIHQGLPVPSSFQVSPELPMQPRLQMILEILGPQVLSGFQESPRSPVCLYLSSLQGLNVVLGFQVSQCFLDPPGISEPQVPPSLPRRKRQERTVYSKEQKQELEESFRKCQYPSYEDCVALAERIGVTDRQIQVWFKNRRAKNSKNSQEQLDMFGEESEVLSGVPATGSSTPASIQENVADGAPQHSPGPSFQPSQNSPSSVVPGSLDAPSPMAPLDKH